MSRRNMPSYTGGRAQAQRIRGCLNLLRQRQHGIGMDDQRAALADAMDHTLTADEIHILQWYYDDCLTQRQVAQLAGLSQSAVSRSVERASRKLAWVMPLVNAQR